MSLSDYLAYSYMQMPTRTLARLPKYAPHLVSIPSSNTLSRFLSPSRQGGIIHPNAVSFYSWAYSGAGHNSNMISKTPAIGWSRSNPDRSRSTTAEKLQCRRNRDRIKMMR